MNPCSILNKQQWYQDRKFKIGNKNVYFDSRDTEYAVDVQMEQINNLLTETYGSRLFDFNTIEEYLITTLAENFGRTDFDFTRNPITNNEAQYIIRDLSELKSLLNSNGSSWIKKKLLTPEKFLKRNAITRAFYEKHQQDMFRNVKRKITMWNEIIDGDSPEITRYFRDETGKPVRALETVNTINLVETMGFNKQERKLLKKWVQLKFDSQEMPDGSPEKTKLEKFEQENSQLIERAEFFADYVESNGDVSLHARAKDLGFNVKNLQKAFENWRDLMDDIFLFDQTTVEKWLDAKTYNGKTYRDLFKEEFRKELELYNATAPRDKRFTNKQIQQIIDRFNIEPPTYRKDYFTHMRYDITSRYMASDIYKVIADLKTGRLKPEVLLEYAKGSEFWRERTDEDADYVKEPITVAESRILSSIQTRKKLMLRALALETLDKLKTEKNRLENLAQESISNSGRKVFTQEVNNLLQEFQTMEEYIRLLSQDSQGIVRESVLGKMYEKIYNPDSDKNWTSPAELDEITAAISRIYRSIKTSAYLGLSVKAGMTNMQQSIGPVAKEFGFKNMINAQKDLGLLGVRSNRGTRRTFLDQNNKEITIDIVDAVGVKYDDIMSLMERGLPTLERNFENFIIKNKQAMKLLDKIEKSVGEITQKTLEYSWAGKLINFVDVEFRNRSVTAVAAYDYRIEQLKKVGTTGKQAHDAAIRFARKSVNDLQFEYSIFNRSEFVRGNLGSSVFLFKSFTVNQTQMQFDWFYDVKANLYKNSKGYFIPAKQIGKLGRWGILYLMNQLFKYKWLISFGIISIEAPVAQYIIDLFKLMFGDDDDKDEAFFGLKQYGAVNSLLGGAASDFIIMPFMYGYGDKSLQKRSLYSTFYGNIPAGNQVREWFGHPELTEKAFGKKKGRFTYFFEPPKSFLDSPASKMFLDFVSGHPVYTKSSKLKQPKLGD